jgi:hypothetical protein
MLALVFAGVVWLAAFPGVAQAHGPVAPVALDYLARVDHPPAGLVAKAVDGDQRMWLQALASETVVVLDYQGAPYLRFGHSGVEVNESSAMYYLNQTPVAAVPPPGLGPGTPPKWVRVSTGHEYGWHDGRLHALATVALPRGASFVGRWKVPIVLDGRRSAISGGLWHANRPSIVWFWPIVVLVACVIAAWRVRRPALDRWTARLLAVGVLAAVTAGAAGQGLRGRPSVSAFHLVELGIILAFVLWALVRVLAQRAGYFTYFAIGIVGLWQGLELVPTLLYGFVLIALPAAVARVATVLALGAGVGLVLMGFRLAGQGWASSGESGRRSAELEGEDDSAWELA